MWRKRTLKFDTLLMTILNKKSWFRFSLRTFLIVAGLLGCFIGPFVYTRHQALRHQAAIKAVTDLGAEIDYEDAPLTANTVPKVIGIRFQFVSDDDLQQLKNFPDLRSVRLDETSISDEGLAYVTRCQNIKLLTLYQTQITDDGLREVAEMTSLEELWLGQTQITDVGLAHLKGLKSLRFLSLHGTNVTDSGVQELHNALPGLQIDR